MLTSDGCFIAREFAELLKGEKQMRSSKRTSMRPPTGKKVKELQIRIAKAVRVSEQPGQLVHKPAF